MTSFLTSFFSDLKDSAVIGTVVEAFFYGMYCLIFGQYLHVHLKKKKNERSIFIYPLAILFLLSTLDFFLNLLQTFWLVLRPGTHQNFLRNADTISVAIYGFADIVSQAVLIYRCWILWNHRPSLVVVPMIMVLTLLGITLVVVIEMCRFEIVPRWTIILAISSICISLASNALVTGLLVLRLTLVHRQCRRAMAQAGRRPHDIQVSPVIMILIETGMMTFVSQLAFVIVLGFRNASAVVFGSPMVMVYGIMSTIIIVRVTMARGSSYNNQDPTSRIHTTMAFAAGDDPQSEVIRTEA